MNLGTGIERGRLWGGGKVEVGGWKRVDNIQAQAMGLVASDTS